MSTAFIKISLLFQYLRIFDRPSFLRSLCIYLIIFVSLWATAYSFLGWVPCVPVAAYWNWTIPATRWAYGSLNSDIFSGTYESHSSVNFALDVLVLAIPVPLYFRPQQSLKSKLRLLALLVIGIACVLSPILRYSERSLSRIPRALTQVTASTASQSSEYTPLSSTDLPPARH